MTRAERRRMARGDQNYMNAYSVQEKRKENLKTVLDYSEYSMKKRTSLGFERLVDVLLLDAGKRLNCGNKLTFMKKEIKKRFLPDLNLYMFSEVISLPSEKDYEEGPGT